MKTLYIVLTFCAGLFLGYLIFPSHTTIEPPDLTGIATTEKRLETIDTIKLAGEVELQKKNDKLLNQLAAINSELKDQKEKLFIERNKVLALVRQVQVGGDSLAKDSLVEQIVFLNATTDSIIRQDYLKDSVDRRMVAIRDSQIVICTHTYQYLKDLLRDQEQREQQLTADLNTALKENKRTRFGNKFLAAGMLFISGLATTLYLKSK